MITAKKNQIMIHIPPEDLGQFTPEALRLWREQCNEEPGVLFFAGAIPVKTEGEQSPTLWRALLGARCDTTGTDSDVRAVVHYGWAIHPDVETNPGTLPLLFNLGELFALTVRQALRSAAPQDN